MSSQKSFFDLFIPQERKDIFAPLNDFNEYLKSSIAAKEYAYRRTLQTPTSSKIQVAEFGQMIMMGSNNYLDFANNPQVVAAAKKALEGYGYGSGSVALLGGTFELHRKLETSIANFYQREHAAVFPTGYSANVGTISALVQEGDLILMDMYAHASLVDGATLSGATVKFFQHNDIKHLEKTLTRLRDKFGGVLIVTDGVFSMDGDVCVLPDLLSIKQKYNARLLIDEAHAIGIIGKEGRGTEEYFNRIGEVDIITGTLSKAPAGIGGYVTGSSKMVEYVRHFASSYIFSTSLPPPVVGGLIEVFHILETDLSHKAKLEHNIERFAGKLRSLGFNIGETITAIIPIIIGDEPRTKTMAKEMAEAGIFCSAVVFPAVSKTQSRLRISLMSSHTDKEIDRVLELLEQLGRKHGVI